MKPIQRVTKNNTVRRRSSWKSILVFGDNGIITEKYDLDELGNHLKKFKKMTPRKRDEMYLSLYGLNKRTNNAAVDEEGDDSEVEEIPKIEEKVPKNKNRLLSKSKDYMSQYTDAQVPKNGSFNSHSSPSKKEEGEYMEEESSESDITDEFDIPPPTPTDNVSSKNEQLVDYDKIKVAQDDILNIYNTTSEENSVSLSFFDNIKFESYSDECYFSEDIDFL